MRFDELHLNPTLLANVAAEGYATPTAIQQQAIPNVLEGRDLVGLAQTGTGKTAAFALPILHRLMAKPSHGKRHVRVLVLAPTRELASQIGQSFATYGKGAYLVEAVIFGGVGQEKQTRTLRDGVDILVATPGRLIDLMQQGFVDLRQLEVFVLDEADRMLDMGFIHDVKRVVQKLPPVRQTLFFSATMPKEVKQLADGMLKNPARVEAHPVASTAERIEQTVYFIERSRKRPLLQHVMSDPAVTRVLVFTRTKQGANRVAEFLNKANIPAEPIHGNKSQNARERALENFTSGKTRVLVATDIAARGIDVEGISHVINFELPNVPETYVHRIGRTARAGAEGVAISFCDEEEREYLRDIQRLIGKQVPRTEVPASLPAAPPPTLPEPSRPHGGRSPRDEQGAHTHGRAQAHGRAPQRTQGRPTEGRPHAASRPAEARPQPARPQHPQARATPADPQGRPATSSRHRR